MDISDWLKNNGFAQHVDAFVENGVDDLLLPELTNEDLKDLGVNRLADRKRLLKAIQELGNSGQNAPPAVEVSQQDAGEYRQVTVLFADIANYTALTDELGPERTHALLNRYFETVDRIIETYGGWIDKHMGGQCHGRVRRAHRS